MQDGSTMKFARIRGVDIHYEVFGEGPPILLVMGLAGRGDNWTPLSQALAAAGHQAIQFDNRDAGWSSQLSGSNYELSDMAADAIGLLDALGIEQANLIGISMGGMIAQEMLIEYPSRVRRAVLMATSPGGKRAVPPEPEVLQNLFNLSGSHSDAIRRVYASITGPGFAEANAQLMDLAVQFALLKPMTLEGMGRQFAALARFSAWERLSKIRTPTLVMHGDSDRLIPHLNGVHIAENIQGAILHTLKGAGHLLPLEAPREVFRLADSFFKETN